MKGVTRRGFFRGAVLGAAAASASGSARADASSTGVRSVVGTTFAGATCLSAERHLGAVALILEDEAGHRFQIDVLAAEEGGPESVATAGSLALFLANRGDGSTPSHEGHGAALLALAEWCDEAGLSAEGLLTWRARQRAHPRGAFLIA
ncbi:MAG: hypothetical protein AAF645_14575 [Myxococcota bacterium]